MAGKTVIDTLVTVLTVDAQGVEKGVDKSNKALNDATKNAKETSQEVSKLTTNYKSLSTAVTFLAATLGASHIVKNSVDIANASARTGQSAGNILALQRAYEKAGFSANEATGTIEAFADAQKQAAFGGDASKWMDLSFGQSGVRDAKGNMTDIVEVMIKAGDQAKRMTRNEQEAMMLLQHRGYSAAAAYFAVNKQAQENYRQAQKNMPLDEARIKHMREINAQLAQQKHALSDVGSEILVGLNPPFIALSKLLAEFPRSSFTALSAITMLRLMGINPLTIALLAAVAATLALSRANDELEKGEKERQNAKTASQGQYRQALAQGATGGGEDDENVLFRSGVKGLSSSSAMEKKKKAMEYFMSQGWSREQAAGLVANIQSESNFDNGAIGDGGKAYGIAQWHPDRQRNFTARFGKDIRQSTYEEQLAFMHYELTAGSESAAGARLRGAGSAGEAGSIVSQYYERPADRFGEARRRGILASSLDHSMRYAGGGAVIGSQTTVGEVNIYAGNADAAGVKTEFDGYAQKAGNNRMFNTGAAS